MEQILMNLIAGALGGNAAGKASPSFDLGTLGNTIRGSSAVGCSGRSLRCCFRALHPEKSTSARLSPS